MKKIIFATRPSRLARWQTNYVIEQLQEKHPDLVCEEIVITTKGDKVLDQPLPEIGGKGLFTQELEEELLAGNVDAAVHSLKDLPVENIRGLTLGAIPVRVDPRDILVSPKGFTLKNLPAGSVVGTSSLRRQSQVLAQRPDLLIKSIRGNVDTRIRKVIDGQYDAAVMAGAGLTRLGLDEHIASWISVEEILPAPGQGALGIQCRADDEFTLNILASIHDRKSANAVNSERAFLQALGGGCSIPVGAYAEIIEDMIFITGIVSSTDGEKVIIVKGQGKDPQALGEALANDAIRQGADEVLNV